MILQDFILASGAIIFCLALLPTIFTHDKPSLFTSIPTLLVLYAFSLTYLSLDLKFACGTTFISATLWDIIAIQKLYQMEIEGDSNDY